MEHISLGSLLIQAESPILSQQLERVAHLCRSSEVRSVGTLAQAKEILNSSKEGTRWIPDLFVLEATRPFTVVQDFVEKVQKSSSSALAGAGFLLLCASNAEGKEIKTSLSATPSKEGALGKVKFASIKTLVSPCTDSALEQSLGEACVQSGPSPKNKNALLSTFEWLISLPPEESKRLIELANNKFPELPEYKCLELLLLQRAGAHTEIISLCEQHLKLFPKFAPLRHLLATSLLASGQISKAMGILDSFKSSREGESFVIKFNTFSNILRSLNNEGIKLIQKGDAAGAEKLYRQAIEASARFPQQHRYLLEFNLGMSLKRQGKLESALRSFAEAAKTSPTEFVEPLVECAKVLEALKRKGLEKEAATRDLPPKNPLPKESTQGANSEAVAAESQFSPSEELVQTAEVSESLTTLKDMGLDAAEVSQDSVQKSNIKEKFSLRSLDSLELEDPFGGDRLELEDPFRGNSLEFEDPFGGDSVFGSSKQQAGQQIFSPKVNALDALRGLQNNSNEFDDFPSDQQPNDVSNADTNTSLSGGLNDRIDPNLVDDIGWHSDDNSESSTTSRKTPKEVVVSTQMRMKTSLNKYDDFGASTELSETPEATPEEIEMQKGIQKARAAFILFEVSFSAYMKNVDAIRSGKINS